MKRYFFDHSWQEGDEILLEEDLFHHIFDVCRVQKGEHFELLNSQGQAFLVQVEELKKKRAQVRVQEIRNIPPLKGPHIYLYLSFPKIPTFETIVEKSVEMGVFQIIPLLSDHSFIRSREQFPSGKKPRWQKIILQATQQSGRGHLMAIGEIQTLEEVLATLPRSSNVINVVAYEGQAPHSLKTFLQSVRTSPIERINLFVGSEGGFSENEVKRFQSLDLPPVTLGDQILRVETACLTLVASLKYEFDLLR